MATSKKTLSARLKQGCLWPSFRLLAGLSLVLFALSFFTPYPKELILVLKGDLPAQEEKSLEERDSSLASSSDPREEDPEGSLPELPEEVVSLLPPLPEDTPAPTTALPESIKPFRMSPPLTQTSLVLPPLPPIIPDGPSTEAVWDINELARGLNLKTSIRYIPAASASEVRSLPSSYRMTLEMEVALPTPQKTVAELSKSNAHLPKIFPQLPELLGKGKVSPFYHKLIESKQLQIRKELVTLNKLLTRHNFYDCDTILELASPQTGRKMLWIQSEMDVVSDGTDGDRLPKMPESIVNSAHYQPFTSYRWPKTGTTPNPLLESWQKRLKEAKAAPASSSSRARMKTLELGIADMKANNFLIAEYDPFIVIPLGILNQSQAYSPSPGDYAVVIYKDKLYPAIVGDAGPRYKIGEASLRLAKEINPKASPYNRPISDLKVSYLIFPASASPTKKSPNYAEWKEACQKLLTEMGGIAPEYSLHDWPDLLAPKPTEKEELPAPPLDKKTGKPSPEDKEPTGTRLKSPLNTKEVSKPLAPKIDPPKNSPSKIDKTRPLPSSVKKEERSSSIKKDHSSRYF